MSKIHIVKLCVGAQCVQDLLNWEKKRGPITTITTRNRPVRSDELLAGGSLYWVIKGSILCRRRIVGLESIKEDGQEKCLIELENRHIPTLPHPRRPFQGWRYLKAEDAPLDLNPEFDQGKMDLLNELSQQGLL